MHRRKFIAGTAAAAVIPSGAFGAERAQRRFRVLRDGKDIGFHSLSATLDDSGFTIEIKIELAVKILGITAYRYSLLNREQWRNQQITSVSTRVDDDGTDDFCKITQDGDALSITGSRGERRVPLTAVTTSYYTRTFAERRPWISTQTGAELAVTTSAEGSDKIRVTGELETLLAYDSRGEWMGATFDAGGETGTYELESETGLIAPLWANS